MSSGGDRFSLTGFELLTVAFVVLKLAGYIDWSWWWVLSPTLIPLAVIAVLGIVCLCLKYVNDRSWS